MTSVLDFHTARRSPQGTRVNLSQELDESYLRNVDECNILTVSVGSEASNPVAAEVQRAKHLNKPILAFAKIDEAVNMAVDPPNTVIDEGFTETVIERVPG